MNMLHWCLLSVIVFLGVGIVTLMRSRDDLAVWRRGYADGKVAGDRAARGRIVRAYLRLQLTDVPRGPWHREVCDILDFNPIDPERHVTDLPQTSETG